MESVQHLLAECQSVHRLDLPFRREESRDHAPYLRDERFRQGALFFGVGRREEVVFEVTLNVVQLKDVDRARGCVLRVKLFG